MRVLSTVLSPRARASLFTRTRAASSGTMQITEPLNFWGGNRVSLEGETGSEPVYEPATGDSFCFPVMTNPVSVIPSEVFCRDVKLCPAVTCSCFLTRSHKHSKGPQRACDVIQQFHIYVVIMIICIWLWIICEGY